MPAPEFFRNLGLYVVRGFLSSERCAQLCSEMVSAPAEKGCLLRDGKQAVTDEEVRKVEIVDLPKPVTLPVKNRLSNIRLDVERHFGIALGACERPQFLVYRQGAFYRPHTDDNA